MANSINKRDISGFSKYRLHTRLVLCTPEGRQKVETLIQKWKEEVQAYASPSELFDCSLILTNFSFRPGKLAIVVKNEENEEQAIATYSLHGSDLNLDHLVVSPKNIMNGQKGSGSAVLLQLIVLAYAFGATRIVTQSLGSASGFYEKLGFVEQNLTHYLFPSSFTKVQRYSYAIPVEGQKALRQIAEVVKRTRKLQKTSFCYWLYAFRVALGDASFERLISTKEGLERVVAWIQRKAERKRQKILSKYFNVKLLTK